MAIVSREDLTEEYGEEIQKHPLHLSHMKYFQCKYVIVPLFQFTVTPPKYIKDETVRLNAELFLQLDHKIVW